MNIFATVVKHGFDAKIKNSRLIFKVDRGDFLTLYYFGDCFQYTRIAF